MSEAVLLALITGVFATLGGYMKYLSVKAERRYAARKKKDVANAALEAENAEFIKAVADILVRIEGKQDALSAFHENQHLVFARHETKLDDIGKSHTQLDKDVGTVLTLIGQRATQHD